MSRTRQKYSFPSRLKSVSTYFPTGTMATKASNIVRVSKQKKYAPKGIGSAIKWIQYYINRNKKRLKKSGQLAELEKAKRTLQALNNKKRSRTFTFRSRKRKKSSTRRRRKKLY